MRRNDRELETKKDIEDIIKKSEVLRIALSVNDKPYIVPVNFGYSNNSLYFHCALEGKKLDMIKINPYVAFELEGKTNIITGNSPCQFTMDYESVMGTGKAIIIENNNEKIKGLNHIMKQYSNNSNFEYKEKMINRIVIVKIDVHQMTGKKSK